MANNLPHELGLYEYLIGFLFFFGIFALVMSPYIYDFFRGKSDVTKDDLRAILEVVIFIVSMQMIDLRKKNEGKSPHQSRSEPDLKP